MPESVGASFRSDAGPAVLYSERGEVIHFFCRWALPTDASLRGQSRWVMPTYDDSLIAAQSIAVMEFLGYLDTAHNH
jgi:hypothetical protein